MIPPQLLRAAVDAIAVPCSPSRGESMLANRQRWHFPRQRRYIVMFVRLCPLFRVYSSTGGQNNVVDRVRK